MKYIQSKVQTIKSGDPIIDMNIPDFQWSVKHKGREIEITEEGIYRLEVSKDRFIITKI